MTEYNHFEYLEKIATKLKAIGYKKESDTKNNNKFFRATEQTDLEELEQRMSVADGTLMIAIDGSDSDFDWKNSDSLMELPSYSFAIIQSTIRGKSSTIFEAQTNSKKTAMQVIARMMNDYHASINGMDLLDPSSFKIKGFGPIRSSFYGVLISFSFNRGVTYKLNNELWD